MYWMQGVCGCVRRGEWNATGHTWRQPASGAFGLERSDAERDQALQGRKRLGIFIREETVHALSGSRVRGGMSIPGVAQGSGERDCELEGGSVHWVPLLHDYLSVSHTAIPVEGVQSASDEVRIVRRPSATRIEAGMHH